MDSAKFGYWEPHSSSVDFCEPNYFVSEYIAEFHNTWSSLLITMLAIVGFLHCNPTNESRFSIMYFFIGAVGIGSVALHCTLHWFPQSSDEIPMLWQSLSMLYALCVMYEEKQSSRTKTIGIIFILIGLLETLVYFCFRQIYGVFIVTFIISSVIVTTWTSYLTFFDGDSTQRVLRAKIFFSAITNFGLYGVSAWLVDMHLCNQLMPYYLAVPLGGFTLHVLWHCFSALGTYYCVLFLIVLRMQFLKQQIQIEYMLGFIPICKSTGNKIT